MSSFSRMCRRFSLFVCIVSLSACSKPPTASPDPTGMALPVTMVQVQTQTVPIVLQAVGQTEGAKEIEVRARVGGILQKQLYKEGEVVRAGAGLFQIERAPYEIALAQARATLEQQQAIRDQAQRELTRLQGLVTQKAISQKEYDDATATAKNTQAAYLAAKAQVDAAQLNLSYTLVTAPISGVSGRAQRSEGSLIGTDSSSSWLTTINQSNPLWVRFSFSEQEAKRLRASAKKAQVRLLLPDGQTHEAVGQLNFAAATVDPTLATVQFRAEFANANQALLPGQFVRVQVTAGEQQAIIVPQASVQQNDQGHFVWVIGSDGKAMSRPVETGSWLGSDWIILGGLQNGDRVITNNFLKLRPATLVQVLPSQAGTAPSPPASSAAASKAASK